MIVFGKAVKRLLAYKSNEWAYLIQFIGFSILLVASVSRESGYFWVDSE